jgi:ABC-type histidine transport system ATPase subunit
MNGVHPVFQYMEKVVCLLRHTVIQNSFLLGKSSRLRSLGVVLFMDKGLVAEEGPARQVLESPKSDRLCTFLSRMSFVGN